MMEEKTDERNKNLNSSRVFVNENEKKKKRKRKRKRKIAGKKKDIKRRRKKRYLKQYLMKKCRSRYHFYFSSSLFRYQAFKNRSKKNFLFPERE